MTTYIVALVTATGAVRFLVSGRTFSAEYPEATQFESLTQAKKAAKAARFFGLEVVSNYGMENAKLEAVVG